MTVFDLFGDYTIRIVAAGAALVGLISGLLGPFAVLRRQSLLGATLSHAALPGICIGFLIAGSRDLPSLMAGALATGVLAALSVIVIVRRSRLKSDAALGIVLSLFFAAGIVLLTYVAQTDNASQGGLNSFLFGQAAATLRGDLLVLGAVAMVAGVLVLLFWKEMKLVTFDPAFAASQGLPVAGIEAAMTTMIALAVVAGLQMVGVVLMVSMIVAPAVAARQWATSLAGMVAIAVLMGMAGGVIGAVLSATGRGLSTGPLIVIVLSVIVLLSLALAPRRGLLWEAVARQRRRRTVPAQQVLTTLYHLAASHGRTDYPSEQGMIDTHHRMATAGLLVGMERSGLVRRVTHAPEATPHWQLTDHGRVEAENLLRARGFPDA